MYDESAVETMKRFLALSLCLAALPGCDQLKDRMGIPNPEKLAAEGKAIGGACRHAGRGLEDCYRINPQAPKPSVYEGWKEMNEYMAKNNMQVVVPEVAPKGFILPRKQSPKEEAEAEKGEDQAAKGGKQDH